MSKFEMTEARIAKFRKEGRGTGRGLNYKPWLTVRDLSSLGRSHRPMGATVRREYQLFSDLENAAFLDCDWDEDVVEIREQFPLERDETRAIAAAMGVRHPRVGEVDIVMTTDLLVGKRRPDGSEFDVAHSVKLASELEDEKTRERTLERLEIERRYWEARGIRCRIVTDRELSPTRASCIAWLHDWRWLENLEGGEALWIAKRDAVLQALRTDGAGKVKTFLARVEARHGWPPGQALSMIRHLAANRIILIDVDRPFDVDGSMKQVRLAPAAESKAA